MFCKVSIKFLCRDEKFAIKGSIFVHGVRMVSVV